MKPDYTLRPCGRLFIDRIFRATFFTVVSSRDAFLPTLERLLARTTANRIERRAILAAVRGSGPTGARDHITDANGCAFRLEPPRRADGNKRQVVVIWCLTGVDVGVLVHEAWHAARWVLGSRGVHVEAADAEETPAHYLQWIVRESLGLRST